MEHGGQETFPLLQHPVIRPLLVIRVILRYQQVTCQIAPADTVCSDPLYQRMAFRHACVSPLLQQTANRLRVEVPGRQLRKSAQSVIEQAALHGHPAAYRHRQAKASGSLQQHLSILAGQIYHGTVLQTPLLLQNVPEHMAHLGSHTPAAEKAALLPLVRQQLFPLFLLLLRRSGTSLLYVPRQIVQLQSVHRNGRCSIPGQGRNEAGLQPGGSPVVRHYIDRLLQRNLFLPQLLNGLLKHITAIPYPALLFALTIGRPDTLKSLLLSRLSQLSHACHGKLLEGGVQHGCRGQVLRLRLSEYPITRLLAQTLQHQFLRLEPVHQTIAALSRHQRCAYLCRERKDCFPPDTHKHTLFCAFCQYTAALPTAFGDQNGLMRNLSGQHHCQLISDSHCIHSPLGRFSCSIRLKS